MYNIIKKWYERLGFEDRYAAMFEELLEKGTLVPDRFTENAAQNLFYALYTCEELERKYKTLGIDPTILDHTLSDIKIWANTWYGLSGELGLQETGWLKNHLSGILFRLGRLQFCMGYAMHDIPQKNITQGAPVIEVHIPEGEPMDKNACKASIRAAQTFFKTYFPDFEYQCFTCHSWLLDKTLEQFLEEDSNILGFQQLFDIVDTEQSDAMLKYIFRWDASREKLESYEAKTKLAKCIKTYALDGGVLFEAYGVVKLSECEEE